MRILVIAVSIALAGLVAAWMLHRHAQGLIQGNNQRLRQQDVQLAKLTADQQSLSNQVTAMEQATNGPAELARLASLAEKLAKMPEGDTTVLDNSCLLFLSNMWSGSRHDSSKVPLLLRSSIRASRSAEIELTFTIAVTLPETVVVKLNQS